jgi:hypothetical protein
MLHHTNTRTRTARSLIAAVLAGALTVAAAGGAHADGRDGAGTRDGQTATAMTPAAADQLTSPPPPAPRPSGPTDLAGLSDSGLRLTSVTSKALGTWARLRYTTNAPSVTIRVSDHQPVFANDVWTEPYMDSIIPPETVKTVDGGGAMKYDDMMLLPATTYYFIITVPTAVNQLPVQAVGTFTTLHRTLTISFDTIHVTDDGDPGLKGDGDFTFWFQVNGKQIASISKDIASDSTYKIAVDGKPLSVVIPDVLHDDVPFGVQIFENDIQYLDSCGLELIGGDAWDGEPINKDNECGTWLELHDFYDASPGYWKVGYGYQESEPIQFELAPWKSSVHLTISGTITAVWA